MIVLAQLAVSAALTVAPLDSAASMPAGTSLPVRDPAPAVDRWWATDKLKHFALAGLTESLAFGGARVVGADRRGALLTGLAVGAGASVAKELADRRSRRPVSGRDLAWDAAGLLAYATILVRTAR